MSRFEQGAASSARIDVRRKHGEKQGPDVRVCDCEKRGSAKSHPGTHAWSLTGAIPLLAEQPKTDKPLAPTPEVEPLD